MVIFRCMRPSGGPDHHPLMLKLQGCPHVFFSVFFERWKVSRMTDQRTSILVFFPEKNKLCSICFSFRHQKKLRIFWTFLFSFERTLWTGLAFWEAGGLLGDQCFEHSRTRGSRAAGPASWGLHMATLAVSFSFCFVFVFFFFTFLKF